MNLTTQSCAVTHSLEDYLETVYLLVRDRRVARVKDIARARGVKMASVTSAMKRLADLGYAVYNQREYIELTAKGEELARRTLARHDMLVRFLTDLLGVPREIAEVDACEMEHHTSDETMDRLVRLFEYIQRRPEEHGSFLDAVQRSFAAEQNHQPAARARADTHKLSELSPGESGTIACLSARGALRQRLIDMGMLPGVDVQVERVAPMGDPLWIRLKGIQLALRREEAWGVVLSRPT